jgi:hypothetical protein
MASPADPAPKVPAAFANARLSLDDAERLAATFRPSWELDDAPFTGAGSLSPSDLHALGGGGTHADVRAVAAHGSNGTHAPAAPAAAEVENSVIIDRSITAQDIGQQRPAARPGTTMMGMPGPQPLPQQHPAAPQPAPYVAPQMAPQAAPQTAPRTAPITRRPAAPSFNVSPPASARAKPVSVDLEAGFPKKSKAGLFMGVAAAAAIVVGGAVWLIASPGNSEKAAPVPTVNKPLEDRLSAVPPPPPETAAATAQPPPPATTAAPPPPATAAAASPPTPIPTTPVNALPQATAAPAPTRAVAVAPRPNYGAAAANPAPRPAARKPGQTIVRDVPF